MRTKESSTAKSAISFDDRPFQYATQPVHAIPPEKPSKRATVMDAAMTPHQAEILAELAKGMRSKEIAYSRGVSPYTIKNTLRRIYQKLGCTDRLEAVNIAYQRGIIGIGPVTTESDRKRNQAGELLVALDPGELQEVLEFLAFLRWKRGRKAQGISLLNKGENNRDAHHTPAAGADRADRPPAR